MRTIHRIALAALLACCPLAVFADHWTGVCSTGSVDEGSLSNYGFTGSSFGYSSASTSTAPLFERFNVTNTFDNNTLGPEFPGWTTLELGYTISAPTDVIVATLFRVDPCTGTVTSVCKVNNLAGATCNICTIPAAFQPVDFGKYLWFVQVMVDRAATADQPRCNTLRLY